MPRACTPRTPSGAQRSPAYPFSSARNHGGRREAAAGQHRRDAHGAGLCAGDCGCRGKRGASVMPHDIVLQRVAARHAPALLQASRVHATLGLLLPLGVPLTPGSLLLNLFLRTGLDSLQLNGLREQLQEEDRFLTNSYSQLKVAQVARVCPPPARVVPRELPARRAKPSRMLRSVDPCWPVPEITRSGRRFRIPTGLSMLCF